jgi:GntR family transcriptional regulator/GntR family frlABCD operon transcriptional regulator
MKELRYRIVQQILKEGIQKGKYNVGSLLPSENELCETYSITRTTARKALEELQKEGFIERIHGKGSVVKERRNSLGLLNVKGFSEAVGNNVETKFLIKPRIEKWDSENPFIKNQELMDKPCLYFQRLRSVAGEPVMIETNWMASELVNEIENLDFVENSFFKTLSRRYLIEITGSEQEIRAFSASKREAELLKIPVHNPVLLIHIRFSTSIPGFTIYSSLVCSTIHYPIGNSYFAF